LIGALEENTASSHSSSNDGDLLSNYFNGVDRFFGLGVDICLLQGWDFATIVTLLTGQECYQLSIALSKSSSFTGMKYSPIPFALYDLWYLPILCMNSIGVSSDSVSYPSMLNSTPSS